jgi:hypothetical protein
MRKTERTEKKQKNCRKAEEVAALQRTSSTITSASLQEMSVQMKLFVLNVARIIMVNANRT